MSTHIWYEEAQTFSTVNECICPTGTTDRMCNATSHYQETSPPPFKNRHERRKQQKLGSL